MVSRRRSCRTLRFAVTGALLTAGATACAAKDGPHVNEGPQPPPDHTVNPGPEAQPEPEPEPPHVNPGPETEAAEATDEQAEPGGDPAESDE